MTTGEIVVQIFYTEAFLSMLGWLFAAAMLVGGILDDDYKSLIRWVFAGAIYVIMEELARHALISQITTEHSNLSPIISVITLSVYTIGLALGWAIVVLAKNRARKQFVYQTSNENAPAQNAPSEEVL
jgi:uncharacterized membrane-anchored protein YhcB (DUF1043 family)